MHVNNLYDSNSTYSLQIHFLCMYLMKSFLIGLLIFELNVSKCEYIFVITGCILLDLSNTNLKIVSFVNKIY